MLFISIHYCQIEELQSLSKRRRNKNRVVNYDNNDPRWSTLHHTSLYKYNLGYVDGHIELQKLINIGNDYLAGEYSFSNLKY